MPPVGLIKVLPALVAITGAVSELIGSLNVSVRVTVALASLSLISKSLNTAVLTVGATVSTAVVLAIFKIGPNLRDLKVMRWALDRSGSVKYLDNNGLDDHVFPPTHSFD